MSEKNMQQPLIEVKDLKEYFNINTGLFKSKPLKAVDGVSFSIRKGETLGLVGESGCGKTTVGRTLLHLYKPTAGEIWYNGKKIETKEDIKEFRKKAAMVFQDPYSSLNPRMTVADIIGEHLDVHKMYSSKQERQERILELMEHVGLNSEHAARYAHEFSGGQRQRIGIAVMYLGRMVELADADEIYDHPLHPYSQSLLSAVPVPDPKIARANKRIMLSGDIPSPLNAPSGCPFRTRCPHACDRCAESMPEFREVSPGHFVACHRVDELN